MNEIEDKSLQKFSKCISLSKEERKDELKVQISQEHIFKQVLDSIPSGILFYDKITKKIEINKLWVITQERLLKPKNKKERYTRRTSSFKD